MILYLIASNDFKTLTKDQIAVYIHACRILASNYSVYLKSRKPKISMSHFLSKIKYLYKKITWDS